MRRPDLHRRRFLRGVGGLALALPALEGWAPRRARAAGPKVYTVFVCQQNGVEPGRFFPTALGPLTAATMAGTALEDLSGHAGDLTVLSGINWAFGNSVGCAHSSGCNTALTASRAMGRANRSLPTRESADMTIGRGLGCEPLNLYAGQKGSFLADAFAYGPGGRVRPADNNPWNVYQRMTGLDQLTINEPGMAGSMTSPPAGALRGHKRQKSVNDLLRAEIDELRRRPAFSADDQRRLELHFQSIRDLETSLTQPRPPGPSGGPAAPSNKELTDGLLRLKDMPGANDLMEDAVRAQLSLIALAFSTDQTQVATLQIGGGNDHTRYLVNGFLAPAYHFVSHHVLSDGDGGAAIPDAVDLHHGIDRIHARFFKHLIERLGEYRTVDGRPLLDDCAAVWMNSLSDGPPHGTTNVPHVIAGGAAGALRRGSHVNVGGIANNRFLNTMITAAGVRKADGAPTDDFGDPDVGKGLLDQLLIKG
jgi:hypothetical protein